MHIIEHNQMQGLSSSYLTTMSIILAIFQNPLHSLIGIKKKKRNFACMLIRQIQNNDTPHSLDDTAFG